MGAIAFDIETMPDLNAMDKLPEPDVKTGNLKDPEKIKAKETEAKTAMVKKMATNPLYGKICCIGYEGKVSECTASEDEYELIRNFLEIADYATNNAHTIVTWNGVHFDFPFIYKRALLLGIETSSTLEWWIREYRQVHPHCDLKLVWNGFNRNEYKPTLGDFAKIVLKKDKIDIDVTTFINLIKTDQGRKEIERYCTMDCVLTLEGYYKAKGILF